MPRDERGSSLDGVGTVEGVLQGLRLASARTSAVEALYENEVDVCGEAAALTRVEAGTYAIRWTQAVAGESRRRFVVLAGERYPVPSRHPVAIVGKPDAFRIEVPASTTSGVSASGPTHRICLPR